MVKSQRIPSSFNGSCESDDERYEISGRRLTKKLCGGIRKQTIAQMTPVSAVLLARRRTALLLDMLFPLLIIPHIKGVNPETGRSGLPCCMASHSLLTNYIDPLVRAFCCAPAPVLTTLPR